VENPLPFCTYIILKEAREEDRLVKQILYTPAANSLMIAKKVPAAWLVQIRDSGHGLMYQYADKFTKVVSTFLEPVS
jgi:hypothetical protein